MSVPQQLYRFRGSLFIPPLVFSLLWFRGETERPLLIWPLGLGLLLIGVALRIWAQEHLHHRLKMPMHLTTTGPYQLVRNPLYIGNTLIYLSATVLSELLWLVPVILLWCGVVYARVVREEEAALLSRYGTRYADYHSQVPRWLPRARCLNRFEFTNATLWPAMVSEVHCLLIALPFLLKETVSYLIPF